MKLSFPVLFALLGGTISLPAQSVPQLPAVTVYSPRVANQAPVGTFAMAVSALRYEPRADLHARNLAEGQADITIRGGIFENTGIRVGGMSLLDPQTGHYLAEIPIAPAMLSAPEILTGAALAAGTSNATVGAVAYGWRQIRTGGVVQAGAGPHGLWRGEYYQGLRDTPTGLGVDVDVAHSESDGPIAFGDHKFDRANVRLQFGSASAQTDLFVGYQEKFFGWPNMYTPFNSNETENLQTLLVAVNHRVELGGGDFVNASAYHRRNRDDYAFNRFAALGTLHPFQHTTWQEGAALEGRRTIGSFAVNARGEVLGDYLKSTSLTAGRYHSRTLTKVAVIPETTWSMADGRKVTAKAGATYDDSNRTDGRVSPVAEISIVVGSPIVQRVYASYAETTQLPSYTALNSSAASGLFRGNPNLGRETSRGVEIGASGGAAGWSINAAVFARRDDDLVDWTFRRGVTARSANAVDVETLGFEAVARRTWQRVEVIAGYTALTKDPDYRGAPVDASFYALNYARHRVTLAAIAQLGDGFELRIDNVARWQAANLLRTVGGDDAVLTTAAIVYRVPSVRGLELTAQMDNVWRSRFQEVPALPASPRLWSIGASYAW